jgi:four helix bundle protein
MELVTEVYSASQGLPKSELYGLTGQMRRAAVSVPSNIAEGYARNSDGDFARFLRRVCGSLYELQTQVEVAQRLGYLTANAVEGMTGLSAEVEKMLSRLIGKVSDHHGAQDA